MANRTATLVRNANLPGIGWRRGTLIQSKNGRIKSGYMLYNGVEYAAPQGTYQVRYFEGTKAVYKSVGNDIEVAQTACDRKNATLNREASDLVLGIPQPEKPKPIKALDEIADVYITEKLSPALGLTKSSQYLYQATLPEFLRMSKRKYPTEITKQDIIAYMTSLIDSGLAQKTRTMRYTVIRGFLMHCGVDPKKLIDASTHNALKKLPELNTAPYSRNEVERLLAVCNPYYKMVFTLLLQSGMRSREAGHLTWANINWETGQIFVPGSQSITKKVKTKVKTNIFQTKSRKGRSIPLYASLRAALQEWRKQHPDTIYVVGTPRGDNPATHWLGTLKTLARQAGLNCGVCPLCVEKGECSKWYLHRMRHTYAHRCLDAKIDLHELSRNLGHSTLAMTLLYLKGRASSNATDPFAPAPVPVADKPKVVMIDAA